MCLRRPTSRLHTDCADSSYIASSRSSTGKTGDCLSRWKYYVTWSLVSRSRPLHDSLHGTHFNFTCTETYSKPEKHLPTPLTSRNLAAFASPHNSPWIVIFMSSSFFPCRGQRYGQAHPLFDTMQLVLSHLLLSPASQTAHLVKSSRANYDLAVVYNWDRPLTTLYRELIDQEDSPEPAQPEIPRKRTSRSKKTPPKVPKLAYELDTHALLHIRNFWHRHLIEESKGFGSGDIVENTYARMAKELMQCGIMPKRWDKPLRDGDLQVASEWYGHYSTLAHWPRKKQELEEVQSLAEDWHKVDPLVGFDTEFPTTTANDYAETRLCNQH